MSLKPLLESGLLNDETKQAISEAWETQLSEAREQITAELREEFAERYDYDKGVMVEAADRMFSDALEVELREFKEERQSLAKARVKYESDLQEHKKAISEFVLRKLNEEVQELRDDRAKLAEGFKRLEGFTATMLESEISEFRDDRKSLAEAKVKLIKESKEKIEQIRSDFVKKASVIAEGAIENTLRNEIKTFREDIAEARKNNFGRKLFEAFTAEFMASHYSRDGEIAKLQESLTAREAKIEEVLQLAESKAEELATVNKKVKLAESRLSREQTLNELMGPLSKSQRQVMGSILESVQTPKLRSEFKKHVDFVINEDVVEAQAPTMLGESTGDTRRSVTGNKQRLDESAEDESILEDNVKSNIHMLQKLAGIKL